jgi:hypothetical protein
LERQQGAASLPRCRRGERRLHTIEDHMALEIAPEKVAYIIFKAREYDAQVPPVLPEDASGSDGEPKDVLVTRPDNSTSRELAAFINGLNEDEQAHLVALAWLGRGTFEPEEFDEAVATARAEHVNSTASYLMGMPLLANYLEDGLEKLGYSVEDIESELP